jgi:hypothetical protein
LAVWVIVTTTSAAARSTQQDAPLLRRRVLENGVQHDDRRYGQRIHDRQDVDAVGTAVDAVLVLDDDHVEAVEAAYGGARAVRGAVHQVRYHVRAGRELGIVNHPDDAERTRPELQVPDQSGAERRQAALRRRIGAEHPDGRRAGPGCGLEAQLRGLVNGADRHVRFS